MSGLKGISMLARSLVAGALVVASAAAQAGFTTIDFSSQFNYGFESGGFIGGNTFPTGAQTFAGVPFQITPSRAVTGAPQNNIWHSEFAGGGNPRVLSITGLSIANAVSGFTLMGTWWGSTNPAVAPTVTFEFGNGSTVSRVLIGGADIRDYNFNPSYTTSLFSPTTQEVFNNAGPIGTPAGQHYDMQSFSFGASAGQTLVGFSISDPGASSVSRSFISGLTIETGNSTSVVPLPAAGWLLLSGIGLLAGLQRRRR
jgi:hypothetical protein